MGNCCETSNENSVVFIGFKMCEKLSIKRLEEILKFLQVEKKKVNSTENS